MLIANLQSSLQTSSATSSQPQQQQRAADKRKRTSSERQRTSSERQRTSSTSEAQGPGASQEQQKVSRSTSSPQMVAGPSQNDHSTAEPDHSGNPAQSKPPRRKRNRNRNRQ
ncbi:hypothetical protein M8J77_009876 [Diaphorina citri]|nr:hypothetical protein M8J77_009876 [Diaphorina citri]